MESRIQRNSLRNKFIWNVELCIMQLYVEMDKYECNVSSFN